MTGFPTRKKKFHYAWIVCFGCALMFFCSCGLTINVFSVYSPFIREAGDFSKTQISTMVSVRSLFQMTAVFATGRFYKKMSLRNGMLIAGLTCALGYTVYGLATTFPMYLAGAALCGFGYGMGAMVPISMVLERWFAKDRTLAVSLVSAASGLASIGIPSLITFVINRYGLRTAFLIEALCIAVLVLISFLLIRNRPGDLSISAYGEKEKKENEELRKSGIDATIEANAAAGRRPLPRTWWPLLYLMIFLTTSFNVAGYSHLSMHCNTEGFSDSIVAIALSAAGGMLMAGKFIFGFLSHRLNTFKTSMIFGIVGIIATALVCVIWIGAVPMLLIIGLYGGTMTMVSVGLVAWLIDWAEPEEYGRKVRYFQLTYAFGGLIMNLLPGIIADACGSYVPFYGICAVLEVIVMVIIWLTYRKMNLAK